MDGTAFDQHQQGIVSREAIKLANKTSKSAEAAMPMIQSTGTLRCMLLEGAWRRQIGHTIMEHVQADAKGPDVTGAPMEVAADTHLGGHEGRSAHGAQHGVTPLEHVGAPKV